MRPAGRCGRRGCGGKASSRACEQHCCRHHRCATGRQRSSERARARSQYRLAQSGRAEATLLSRGVVMAAVPVVTLPGYLQQQRYDT
eukprot:SAG25_NODE_6776_length_530_cov_1.322506_1_plen_86_part_10